MDQPPSEQPDSPRTPVNRLRVLRFDTAHKPVRPPLRPVRPQQDDDRRDEDQAA